MRGERWDRKPPVRERPRAEPGANGVRGDDGWWLRKGDHVMTRAGRRLLATMITTTTYGTWLPGDLRGYVEKGVILPGDPDRLTLARSRMAGEPVYLSAAQQREAFDALQAAAVEFGYALLAASIESWHTHMVVDHGFDGVSRVAGRLKTRMRQSIRIGRVWATGYDKRYCFIESQVSARTNYVNRHAGARAIPSNR